MTPETLAAALEHFLSASSNAVVMEGGAVVFDLAQAKYSISSESNKCLLHWWSSERNVVRRVLDVEIRGKTLRSFADDGRTGATRAPCDRHAVALHLT